MDSAHNETKAVLLVGGMGTRLRSVVQSMPKPLASVGKRPFLELLVQQLRYQGFRQLVMCTGYLAHQIENELGDGHELDVTIEYSKEPSPLGTAGAVKFAEPLLREAPAFLVMNGDSFMEMDFQALIQFHRQSRGIASMAVVRVKNEMRYGTVQLNTQGRVTGFAEKGSGDPQGYVNAGIYVFDRRIFEHIPNGPSSLEGDIFPRLLRDRVYASRQHGVFIDIGIPEDYARAQELCEQLYVAAHQKRAPGTEKRGGRMKEGDNFERRVTALIEASIATKQSLLGSPDVVLKIAKVSEILVNAFRHGYKVFLFGNGGSAADAQHIAAEFVGRFAFDRPALPAMALSVNSSCVTAIGNDYGFDQVFSRQLEALARAGDVAIGISTSGNSPNVVHALSVARKMGLQTVALTGCTGGELLKKVDYCICAPSKETPRIQECHILIGHIISELVEREIFHEESSLPRP